ncbi:MAG TPA: polysaccharide biosynthesis tyrosine autokinase [Blastocatellia bacterium]|jgi:capsular exopolysaccharide synthesis family protein|nr:polysaccharide biosynthesis tyrosine autokinase [Blastocatellia bacterium]
MSEERFELEKAAPREEISTVRAVYPKTAGSPSYGYGYGYGAPDDRMHVRELWRTVRKRKWLVLVIAMIVSTIATIEVFRTKATYQASTTLEIGKDNTMLVKSGDLVVEAEESDLKTDIKTRMLVLTSHPLLEDVIVNLKLDSNPKFLEVKERKSLVEALRSLGRANIGGDAGAASEPAPSADMSAADLKSTRAQAERSSEESARLAPFVEILEDNLSVQQIRDTRALQVSFTHTDPELAALVTNGIVRDFMQRSFENKTEKFTNTSEWLDRSTRELKAKVEQAEQALANYSREHNIFSTDGKEATLTTDKLARLHDQVMRAETDRILKQSLFEEVKAGRVEQLPDAFADPKSIALQAKLGELATLSAQLGVKYGRRNPRVVEVEHQMANLQQQIDESKSMLQEKLRADYERAVRDDQSLKLALDRAKAEAVQQNQDYIQYNIIKQDVDTSKALYTDFLQKTNQAHAQVAEQHNPMRVIQPARAPTTPVGPKRLLTMLLGAFAGLAAGMGLAFFLEYIDNTIKSVEDVSRYAQLPALGVIPMISSSSARSLAGKNGRQKALKGSASKIGGLAQPGQLMALDNRSSAAEAYRVLRTSVLLSAAGNPPKTILITSSQPGEGKTTTTVNTAISLAQLGASVLVIDCDLRKPTTHKVLGADPSRGLSTYLSRSIEIDGLIQKLQIPNLSLLPCGPIPPNPAELISSAKMKHMLQLLADRYDHILIDAPPLINVADPVILSTLVDGVILVVHGGKSTRDIVRRSRHELAGVGAKIFGVVLNNVDLRNEGYENYYYSNYGEPAGSGVA